MELQLNANPNYYDYYHRISLFKDGICHFLDGGGQIICLDIQGIYQIAYDTETNNSGTIEFKFKNAQCAIHKNKIYNKNIVTHFRVQHGLFMLKDEIVWHSTLENYPFSVYTKRYIFDTDPFDGLYENRQCSLYFMVNGNKEIEDSMIQFYPTDYGKSKRIKELDNDELDELKKLYQIFYTAYIQNPKMKASDLY